jgi:hypothetical protein
MQFFIQFFNDKTNQNTNFAKLLSGKCVFFYHFKFFYQKIEVLLNCSAFFVPVSLVRGKYEGMRENKKHIFQTIGERGGNIALGNKI